MTKSSIFLTEPILKIRIIKYRTHVHATESIDKVINALKTLIPEELGEFQSNELKIEHMLSQFNTPIKSISITISKQSRIKSIISYLAEKMGDEMKNQLSKELELRVGDKNRFYFRLDKQLLAQNIIKLKSGSDVVQVIIAPINKNPKAEFTINEIRKYFKKLNLI